MMEFILPFIAEIDRLKKVERQTLIHSGGRRENSAEHSWHLAMTVLVFEKLSSVPLDVAKAVKMALLHDLVEIDAGDTIVYGHQPDKKAKEEAALERIVGLLPAEIATDLKAIWYEFELGESAEAKFVSAIDRFLPIYSNFLNEGHSWVNHKISAEVVSKKCQPIIDRGLPGLWEVTSKMLDQSIRDGHLSSEK